MPPSIADGLWLRPGVRVMVCLDWSKDGPGSGLVFGLEFGKANAPAIFHSASSSFSGPGRVIEPLLVFARMLVSHSIYMC